MTERDQDGACKECGNGRAESASDQTAINYKGYQIDMSEHSGGWWYNIYPPGGEKNIGGVLPAPFDRRDQAERSAKEEVDQHMANYGDHAAAALASLPSLRRVLASDLYTEAAPRKSPEMREAEKQFNMPEMSEARFYIRKTRALGGNWWDVTMTIPASANFLKAKDMHQFKENEFFSYGTNDPIEVLVIMANKALAERVGVKLGRASISTVDLKRQRARNGMKSVTMDWQVRDALQAYALGLDLTEWSGGAELVKSKEEYQQRLRDAEQARQQAKELREAVKAGQKTQEDWKAFVESTKAKGMNYEVTSPDMVRSNYPAIARVVAEAPFEEPVKDETDDEDGSPHFMDKKSEAAPLPMKKAGSPALKEEHLPVNIKRDVIKNLYSNIGEKMFGFSPEHIQWMQSAIDQMMSDRDVEREWSFIKKGNVEKLLNMMGQIQKKAGPEDIPELEEMQGLWESVARGIVKTKQAHREISDEEWSMVEESLMEFTDRFTEKLEQKGELPGQNQDALPGGERRRLGSSLTKEIVASFFLPLNNR